MHSRGFVLNLPSQQGSHHTSWSTAPRLFYLPTSQYDEGISEDSRWVDVNGLEEARCAALVQSTRYLEGIWRYHDRNVKERSFNVSLWSSPLAHPERGRTTQAQLAMGGSLLDCKGDRTRLVSPPNTWRWQHQQLVEHRPALSILRIVSRLLSRSPSLYDYYWALRCKGPPGPSTILRTTLLQDPTSMATNGSRAVKSIKDSSSGLQREDVLLDPAYTATNGSIDVSGDVS
jgi:hypothetical protein